MYFKFYRVSKRQKQSYDISKVGEYEICTKKPDCVTVELQPYNNIILSVSCNFVLLFRKMSLYKCAVLNYY